MFVTYYFPSWTLNSNPGNHIERDLGLSAAANKPQHCVEAYDNAPPMCFLWSWRLQGLDVKRPPSVGSTENVRPYLLFQPVGTSQSSPYLRSGLGEEHSFLRYSLLLLLVTVRLSITSSRYILERRKGKSRSISTSILGTRKNKRSAESLPLSTPAFCLLKALLPSHTIFIRHTGRDRNSPVMVFLSAV